MLLALVIQGDKEMLREWPTLAGYLYPSPSVPGLTQSVREAPRQWSNGMILADRRRMVEPTSDPARLNRPDVVAVALLRRAFC